jgi:hypothetical protein
VAKNLRNKSTERTGGTDHALAPGWEKNHRQSERVSLALPIRVSRVPAHDGDFLSEGQTVDISRQGATLKLDRTLDVGETIKIQQLDHGEEVMARVVRRVTEGSEGHLFAVAISNSTAGRAWGVVFPEAARMDGAVLRVLLTCLGCHRSEVCYLDEFEADFFLSHQNVSRICKPCGGSTTWIHPRGCASTGRIDAVPSGTRERRSHGRIQVETVGCVRHPALGNEVVVVTELTPRGLSFYSAAQYSVDSCVEIAVPYSFRAPNIYAPARIVSSRKGKGNGVLEHEYGVAYLE